MRQAQVQRLSGHHVPEPILLRHLRTAPLSGPSKCHCKGICGCKILLLGIYSISWSFSSFHCLVARCNVLRCIAASSSKRQSSILERSVRLPARDHMTMWAAPRRSECGRARARAPHGGCPAPRRAPAGPSGASADGMACATAPPAQQGGGQVSTVDLSTFCIPSVSGVQNSA